MQSATSSGSSMRRMAAGSAASRLITASTGIPSSCAIFENQVSMCSVRVTPGCTMLTVMPSFRGFDLSLFGENLTNEHPLMFLSRDIPPDTPASAVDPLYFARGVRPRTIGMTGTYRF